MAKNRKYKQKPESQPASANTDSGKEKIPGINELFLPYQQRWLGDNSKIKIWEKSRRIGATYVQSYEDVICHL